jgi:adenylosuccinate synthase
VVIDAVRIAKQVDALRRAFGRGVFHVHLIAPEKELSRRYANRESEIEELPSYRAVAENPTEAAVDDLAQRADIVIDTSRNTPADVEVRCAARLGLLSDTASPTVDVVVGGGYGSEGKGNVAFHLAPEYGILVRSGGPNAGHKVPVEPIYTHRLLPSGTLANDDAHLAIAPGATIDVDVLLGEIADCGVEKTRLSIDPGAFVIEDSDKKAEAKGRDSIGSTASGAGAAASRRILGARLHGDAYRSAGDVSELRHYLNPISEVLREAAERRLSVLLEGTQGSGLSLFHGSFPHVTSRDTNVGGLLAEVGLPASSVRHVVLVTRTYPIRVGGPSGPMGVEIEWKTIADRSGLSEAELLGTEVGSVSGSQRRVAEFDWTLLRKSAELNAATDIALTFVDYIDGQNRDAYRFEQLTLDTREFIEEVELVAGCPVSMVSTNFGHGRGLIDRRSWRGSPRYMSV